MMFEKVFTVHTQAYPASMPVVYAATLVHHSHAAEQQKKHEVEVDCAATLSLSLDIALSDFHLFDPLKQSIV